MIALRKSTSVLVASLVGPAIAIAQHMNEPGVPGRDVAERRTNAMLPYKAHRSDAELNASYSAIRKILSAADQENLRTARPNGTCIEAVRPLPQSPLHVWQQIPDTVRKN